MHPGVIGELLGPPAIRAWAEALARHTGLTEEQIEAVTARPQDHLQDSEAAAAPSAEAALAGLILAEWKAQDLLHDSSEHVEDAAIERLAEQLANERIAEAVDAALQIAREEWEASRNA